jgi:actin related protein 2/3 complex, subunit 3
MYLFFVLVSEKTSSSLTATTPSSWQSADILGPENDVIDEAILLFRANCLFRHFEMKSRNDRLLVYLTLFISELLVKLKVSTTATEAAKVWSATASSLFCVPGDSDFPLASLYPKVSVSQRNDTDTLRAYLLHLRQELVLRLHEVVFGSDKNTISYPNKWWICFQKKRFMNKTLTTSST